jgi:hypothetical protein
MRDLNPLDAWMIREWSEGRHDNRQQRERANSLKNALSGLRVIAKNLGAENPDAEAEKTKNRLLRHIANQEAARVRDQRYDASIASWRSVAQKPNKRWACHLVRLDSNMRSIGRLRGPHPLSRKEAIEWAINDAASVRAEELCPVERRAVEMLERGFGKKQRVRSRKNAIEKRALRLAKRVKRKWFPNKQNSKVGTNHDVDRPIRLSKTDVISIAAPIIEEFAKGPIAFRKRGSLSNPPSFKALYWIVRACAKDGAQCKESTVNRLLSHVRKRADPRGTQDQDLRIDIAPELLGASSNKR